jgi:uncharacterized protein (TIGR03382 family)
MCGHDAESTKEKITSYEAAYELWKNHPLRKKKRVMEMFFLMALAQATSEDFERSTGLLGRLRKLATDTYGEHSLQVVSVEREAAVALHLAKRNDEAETLLLKCMKQEEELIPSTDVGRFHILLTGYISVTRFFARIGKYAVRRALLFRCCGSSLTVTLPFLLLLLFSLLVFRRRRSIPRTSLDRLLPSVV